MFEHRLKILLILAGALACVLAMRFTQVQLLQAGQAATESESLLHRPPKYYPFLRGRILDHEGRPLAYDAPTWDISIAYGAMVGDETFLRETARDLFPDERLDDALAMLDQRIRDSWRALIRLTAVPRTELAEVVTRHVRRIQRIKQAVEDRQGIEVVIAEELMTHPVVRNLSQDQQVAARIELKDYPWIEVTKSHDRVYRGGPAMAAILGRMAEVDAATLDDDPNMDDPLARYWPGERHGISGIEAIAEQVLRGKRGRTHEDAVGRPISEAIEPVNGRDYRLTIDLGLQRSMYNELASAVERTPYRSGGAAVLLDIPSRHILGMVSYPSIDPNDPAFDLDALTPEEKLRQPFVFRAVRQYYPPGSIVKPMLLAAAMTDGALSPSQTFHCEGRLFPGKPHWACTAAHGDVGSIFAIQHSCNVFFYNIGELMGVPAISNWMSQFGFGRRAGTGLAAEKAGRLPEIGGEGDARNLAIGQGALDVTPIQAANMVATVASGVFREVTMDAEDRWPRPSHQLNIPESVWRTVREGMYQVVNTKGGTAFGPKKGELEDAGHYVLLGKTGSAEAPRRPLKRRYTCHFPDGDIKHVIAASEADVLKQYPDVRITGFRTVHFWPEQDPPPTHAWFVGYLTSKSRYLEPANSADLNVAIAVVIEYSGHGGDVAAPVAKRMIQSVIHRQRGDVPDPEQAGGAS